jgi:hypothetical protein
MLDDLLFTLEVARKSLPNDVDPVHFERLDTIERMVKRALEQEQDYWRSAMEQAEQLGDDKAMHRLQASEGDTNPSEDAYKDMQQHAPDLGDKVD